MKRIFEIPLRTFLLTIGVLLLINLLVLLFGGLYSYYPAGNGIMYMRNRITGTLYFVAGGTIDKVSFPLTPKEWLKQRRANLQPEPSKEDYIEEARRRGLTE